MIGEIAAMVGAVFGSQVLVTIFQNFFNRRKTKAEADSTAIDAALKYTDAITKRVEKLESDLESMRRENLQLHLEVERLKTELDIYKNIRP